MVTATVTNLSSTTAIGPQEENPTVYPAEIAVTLPGCMSWATIPASGSKDFVLSIADLEASATTSGFGGAKVKDVLQDMIQKGQITVVYAALGATDRETLGKAINVE